MGFDRWPWFWGSTAWEMGVRHTPLHGAAQRFCLLRDPCLPPGRQRGVSCVRVSVWEGLNRQGAGRRHSLISRPWRIPWKEGRCEIQGGARAKMEKGQLCVNRVQAEGQTP